LVCSGAFSESWQKNSPPVGLCVDNGYIVNRNLIIGKDRNGNSLDGLIIVYGGGDDRGGIVVKDIEHDKICTNTDGINRCYDLKGNWVDRYDFIQWAKNNYATVFQVPLMYSSEYGVNYGSLNNGQKAERRGCSKRSHRSITIPNWQRFIRLFSWQHRYLGSSERKFPDWE